jgi:hypothetical protein
MVRRLVYVLAIICAVLLAVVTFRQPTAAPSKAPGGGIDWTNVSSRDLNIASVFVTARDVGVRKALDSLEALSLHDPQIRGQGHALAHALGRYAIAENKNDVSVIAQCREIFEAGCYHGVLEGYLATQKSVDRNTVASICSAVERANTSRQPALECSHGLGHGLLARLGYDLGGALSACDYLPAKDAQGECHDGVFMENVVHGMGDAMINVGDDALSAHSHMMQMEGSHAHHDYFRKQDLAFPCDSVAQRYESSCWSYQPLVVIRLTGVDFNKTLHECDTAPADGAITCYRGFGKQSTAWYSDRAADIVKTCEGATSPHAGDCLAGAVEAYVDFDWTPDKAIAFCRNVPADAKAGCYSEMGARMGLIRVDNTSLAADCRRAEPQYIAACMREGAASQMRAPQSGLSARAP